MRIAASVANKMCSRVQMGPGREITPLSVNLAEEAFESFLSFHASFFSTGSVVFWIRSETGEQKCNDNRSGKKL